MFLPAQEEPNAASSSEAPDLPKSPKSPKARRAKNAAVTSHENQEKNCEFFWDFQWDNDEIIVQLVGQWMKNGWRIDEKKLKKWMKNGWQMDEKWMKTIENLPKKEEKWLVETNVIKQSTLRVSPINPTVNQVNCAST